MKNIYLSLEETVQNQQLRKLIENDPQFNIVDKMNDEERYTVIVNGPLTELSNLLLNRYSLKNNIDEVFFIGGTDCYGDVSPVGEKNVMADVNSAQSVFLSKVKVVVCGLNITREMKNRALTGYVYLKDKSVFTLEDCGIFIETKGTVCYGKMVNDVYSDAQFSDQHCQMVMALDKEKYLSIVNEY
ncbi:MAG: nucleoside hydrolase [Erysipelotrichaceae bacterium]